MFFAIIYGTLKMEERIYNEGRGKNENQIPGDHLFYYITYSTNNKIGNNRRRNLAVLHRLDNIHYLFQTYGQTAKQPKKATPK